MKLNHSLTAVLLSSAVMYGCSDGSPNSAKSPPDVGSTTPVNDPISSNYDKYNGDYLFPCQAEQNEDVEDFEGDDKTDIDEPLGDVYVYQTLNIQNPTLTLYTAFYTDPDCTIPHDNGDEERITLSIVYTGGTTQTELGVADHVDITMETFLINGVNATDSDEEGDFNVGDTVYDIFFLDDPTLYIGNSEVESDSDVNTSGTSPETRPTELDPYFAIRQ